MVSFSGSRMRFPVAATKGLLRDRPERKKIDREMSDENKAREKRLAANSCGPKSQ